MHVTHLDGQIIATRFVLSSAIPPRGVPELRPCERGAWQRDLSNGIIQQTPRVQRGSGRPTHAPTATVEDPDAGTIVVGARGGGIFG